MTTKQKNYRGMLRNTVTVIAARPATGADEPIIAALATALEKQITAIDDLDFQQSRGLAGVLAVRDAAFLALAEETVRVAALARGAARQHGRQGLVEDVRLRARDLSVARFDDRLKVCENVAKAVRAELPNLADSAITEPVVAALEARVADAANMLLLPRDVVGAKRAATAGLLVAFRETNRLLKTEIDPLMTAYARTDPVYYERYLAARDIVDRPATRTTEDPAEDAEKSTIGTTTQVTITPAVTQRELTAAAA